MTEIPVDAITVKHIFTRHGKIVQIMSVDINRRVNDTAPAPTEQSLKTLVEEVRKARPLVIRSRHPKR